MPRAQVTGELEDSSSSHTCQRSDAIITIIDTELLPVEREENPNALSLSHSIEASGSHRWKQMVSLLISPLLPRLCTV